MASIIKISDISKMNSSHTGKEKEHFLNEFNEKNFPNLFNVFDRLKEGGLLTHLLPERSKTECKVISISDYLNTEKEGVLL